MPNTAWRRTPFSEKVHASEPMRISTGLNAGRAGTSKTSEASEMAEAKLAALRVEMRYSSSRWRDVPSRVRKMVEVGKGAISSGRFMPCRSERSMSRVWAMWPIKPQLLSN